MAYPREEQETTLVFETSTGQWNIYSTVPKHIRKLSNLCEIKALEVEDGQAVAIKGVLDEKQVSMKKIRVLSDEQKRLAAERLAKVREK